jgi:hypothetical protein
MPQNCTAPAQEVRAAALPTRASMMDQGVVSDDAAAGHI